MPVLPITDGKGELSPLASAIVNARMFNPRDEWHYQCCIAWSFVAVHAFSDEVMSTLPREALALLLEAPGIAETVASQEADLLGALSAGNILLFALTCKACHPEYPPSVTRAWEVYAAHHKELKSPKGSGWSVPFVRREWSRFKPVAHLWAAHLALCEPEDDPLPPRLFSPNAPEKLLRLLDFAEFLRKEAESTFAHGRDVPILNPLETWSCPVDLELPKVEFQFTPLQPDWLRLLRRSKKRSTRKR